MNEHTVQIASSLGSLHTHRQTRAWISISAMLIAAALLVVTARLAAELWFRSPALFLSAETSSSVHFPTAAGLVVNLPASNVRVVASNDARTGVGANWELVYAGASPSLTHRLVTADGDAVPDAPLLLTVDLDCASMTLQHSSIIRQDCWADHAFTVPTDGDVQITTSMGSIDVYGVGGELTLFSTARPRPSLRESILASRSLLLGRQRGLAETARGTSNLEGRIFVSNASGPLTAYSAYGDIVGTELASPQVDIHAAGIRQRVYLQFVQPPEQIVIEAQLADSVIVELPPGDAYRVEISQVIPPAPLANGSGIALMPVPFQVAERHLQIDVEQDSTSARIIRLQVQGLTQVHLRYTDSSN